MESRVNIPNQSLAPNPVLSDPSVGSRFQRRRGGLFGDEMEKPCEWKRSCNNPISLSEHSKGKYCIKHYRLFDMRQKAKKKGKTVPSYDVLNALLEDLLPEMLCPVCNCAMGWRLKEAGGRVLTLQHDYSGAFKLICLSCNIRHSKYPSDEFYTIGKTHKYCSGCDKMLPRISFGPAGRKNGKKRTQFLCRPCEYLRQFRWREKRHLAGFST